MGKVVVYGSVSVYGFIANDGDQPGPFFDWLLTGDVPGSLSSTRRTIWRHNGAMPSVQIKDVPDEVHATLRRRAEAAHQSLQEYLRSRLIEEASQPTLDEVLERASSRSRTGVTIKAINAAVREERDRH